MSTSQRAFCTNRVGKFEKMRLTDRQKDRQYPEVTKLRLLLAARLSSHIYRDNNDVIVGSDVPPATRRTCPFLSFHPRNCFHIVTDTGYSSTASAPPRKEESPKRYTLRPGLPYVGPPQRMRPPVVADATVNQRY